MALLTVRELRAMKDGDRLSESAGRGQGTLRFRKTGGRVRVYFRFTKPDGARDELPIGWYDENGRDGWTLVRVREEAAKIREQYQSGSGDVRADQDAERAAREAARRAEEAVQAEAERRARERQQFTLGALCAMYCTMLDVQGKAKGAKDARAAFKVHLFEGNPELAKLPANEVEAEQIAELLRGIRAAGKHRTAGVVRSYLNAAFNAAIKSRLSTDAAADFRGFNLKSNPIATIEAIPVQAGDRVLTHAELRGYLGALGDGIIDQALLLALLAGGQRMAQLLRARIGDWDHGILRLWDDKGRRTSAREHLLPLGPNAAALVDRLVVRAKEHAGELALKKGEPTDPNPSLFMSLGGARVVDTTPGKRLIEIAEHLGCPPFNLRDVRRTVETELQRLRIARDVRAVLLSHGMGGVQGKHYERFDFLDEKRAALEAWERFLFATEGGNVVEMRQWGAA